jgi:hypothetical protein
LCPSRGNRLRPRPWRRRRRARKRRADPEQAQTLRFPAMKSAGTRQLPRIDTQVAQNRAPCANLGRRASV